MVLEHVPGRRCPLADAAGWHVLVELVRHRATRPCSMTRCRACSSARLERGLVTDAVVAASEAQRAAMWEVRHSVSEANKKAGVGPDHRLRGAGLRRAGVHRSGHRCRARASCRTCRSSSSRTRRRQCALHPVLQLRRSGSALADSDAIASAIRMPSTTWRTRSAARSAPSTASAARCTGEMARYKPAVEIALMRAIKQAARSAQPVQPGPAAAVRSTARSHRAS